MSLVYNKGVKLILAPNEIYFESMDDAQREILIFYLENEIETQKIYHEYLYESSLLEMSDIFTEAENQNMVQEKKENIFVRAIKGIIGAIGRLFGSLRDAVLNVFGKDDHITPEQYFDSPQGKIKLSTDMNELDRIASNEIRKGNALIQKISSATGISDETIDEWLAGAGKALKKAIPVVVPAAITFGCRKIIRKGIKKMQADIDRNKAIKESDPKKQKKILRVVTGMQNIVNGYTSKAKQTLGEIKQHHAENKAYKQDLKGEKPIPDTEQYRAPDDPSAYEAFTNKEEWKKKHPDEQTPDGKFTIQNNKENQEFFDRYQERQKEKEEKEKAEAQKPQEPKPKPGTTPNQYGHPKQKQKQEPPKKKRFWQIRK